MLLTYVSIHSRLELRNLVNKIHLREQHSPAAIPGNSQIVHDLLRILTISNPSLELLVLASYRAVATVASDWYYHLNITCSSSASSRAEKSHSACKALSA